MMDTFATYFGVAMIIAMIVLTGWMIDQDSKEKKRRRLEELKNYFLREGNVLKFYEPLAGGKLNPFLSNVRYIRIMEERDGWIWYEDQMFNQCPGKENKLVSTSQLTKTRDELYDMLKETDAKIVRNNNPK